MPIQTVKTPFQKMTFTPDIPSGALGPNEYNDGLNVETDIRGIKKIFGEIDILSAIPGDPCFVTGSFRNNNIFNFIVANTASNWYAVSSAGITNITPNTSTYIKSYNHSTSITASWNGNVVFIMDTINPPMYLLPTGSEIKLYDVSYIDQTPNTYVWNYYANQGWQNLSAGFQRVYSSPNVGSILVAGNLTYVNSGTVVNLPNTIRWSQAFGLNSGPTTWTPTITNIANEVDVPVRGPLVDGFPLNGNFYMFSYWDCAILQPIAYTSTAAPVFGVSLVTRGRGMLNENCWAIDDSTGFGLDSSDIWLLQNGQFQEIGNQRVKNWFYGNLNPSYINQVFVANNTRKNQFEIYYPDLDSTSGRCNKMLAYRYDLDCWNPPREVHDAVAACEGPDYSTTPPNIANRGIIYARSATTGTHLVEKDIGNGFYNGTTNTNIYSYFRRDNINFGEPYSNKIQVHRVLPEVYGSTTGTFTIQIGGADSVGSTATFRTTATVAINTSNPWITTVQNTQRVTSIIAGTYDNTSTWVMSQANWQISIIEDSR
jgi:hypothetical protein